MKKVLSIEERRLAIYGRLAERAYTHADHDHTLQIILNELSRLSLQDAVAETDTIIKAESKMPELWHSDRLKQLIANHVETTRRRAGLSKDEAAKLLGLSAAAYNKRESGAKDITVLELCLMRERIAPEQRPLSPIPLGTRSYQD